MLVRYNNDDGTHGYEEIDFRETMPAAGNQTVSVAGEEVDTKRYADARSCTDADVLGCRCQPDLVDHRRTGCWSPWRDAR